MTARQFQTWRSRCGFATWQAAADALGISLRQVMRYAAGERQMSLTEALACEALSNRHAAYQENLRGPAV